MNILLSYIFLYLTWMVYTWKLPRSTCDIGPLWLVRWIQSISKVVLGVLGVTGSVVMEFSPDRTKQYMFACGPHGTITICGTFFAIPFWRLSTHFQHHTIFPVGASGLFYIPLMRELFLILGGRDVSKDNVHNILSHGRSISLIPGGIWEMIHTDHRQEKIYVQKNLGFCRLAVEYGLSIVPCYGFGENQMYTTHTFGFRIRRWISRKCRFGLPLITGRWGCTPLPHPTSYVAVYGVPIDTKQLASELRNDMNDTHAPEEIEEKIVTEVYSRYRTSMLDLFRRYSHRYLPSEVSKRGLIITRLGHDPEPDLSSSCPKNPCPVFDLSSSL